MKIATSTSSIVTPCAAGWKHEHVVAFGVALRSGREDSGS